MFFIEFNPVMFATTSETKKDVNVFVDTESLSISSLLLDSKMKNIEDPFIPEHFLIPLYCYSKLLSVPYRQQTLLTNNSRSSSQHVI